MSKLWKLVWGKATIDPTALSVAIDRELRHNVTDFRTRLLIKEGTEALRLHWGTKRLEEWMDKTQNQSKIEAIQIEDFGANGFYLSKEQLVDNTEPETVREYLRELGSRTSEPVSLEIGGSIALILSGYLSRATVDIDIVDEVPPQLRNQHELLDELQQRYRLLLTQFQSHYLPAGWQNRLQEMGRFGSIQISLVNVYDIFLGKLFSKRTKDLDDLRAIKASLDKAKLVEQLLSSAASLISDPVLHEVAKRNWYILFGEDLP